MAKKKSIEVYYNELLDEGHSIEEIETKLYDKYDFNDVDSFLDNNKPKTENYETNEDMSGEDPKATVDRFFDVSTRLERIERELRGYHLVNGVWKYRGNPVGRDEFIDFYMENIRSIKSEENFVARLEVEEVKAILLEKNIEFIDFISDEPEWSIADEKVIHLINTHDHHLQLFLYGLTAGAQGADIASKLSAGLAYEKKEQADKEALLKLGSWELNSVTKKR